MFWLFGICTNSTLSNSYVKCFINLRYFCILSIFASYSSFIYPITNLESLWRSRFLAPRAFPTLSPVNIPSNSASLLMVKNFRWTLYLIISSSGMMITTPTPPLFWADESSVCIIYRSVLSGRLSSFGRVSLAMKSAKVCILIAVLGWYSMSNWLSSIAH